MARVRYIDPEFKIALDKVSPVIKRETSYEFDISRRIRDILKRKHWSQAMLAKATGKKEATVSLWLSGTHNFTIRTIAEIESALNEDILSIRQYRKPSETVCGYISNRPAYTGLLNDGND